MRSHVQCPGDFRGLIDPTGTNPPDIQLLEGDNIGVACADNLGDALRRQLAVRADASVNVIGHDPECVG
jgi:hypothetical protein